MTTPEDGAYWGAIHSATMRFVADAVRHAVSDPRQHAAFHMLAEQDWSEIANRALKVAALAEPRQPRAADAMRLLMARKV